jgi:hypothetical protein
MNFLLLINIHSYSLATDVRHPPHNRHSWSHLKSQLNSTFFIIIKTDNNSTNFIHSNKKQHIPQLQVSLSY